MFEYEKTTKINVDCTCGCSSLEISQWKVDDKFEGISISHKIPSFYALQKPGWEKFKDAIKMIFHIIKGEEYYFYDIELLKKQQIIDFKNAVSNLDENIEEYD